MKLYTGSKSGFAIRQEDAISWHNVSKEVAGIAERSGYNIRPIRADWQIWATKDELCDLISQL